ncbi:hypothetical protein ACLOJK_013091 [Asimina triloba]
MAKARFILGVFLLAFALLESSIATPQKSAGMYEIKKGNFSVKLTNFGAIVISVILPDSKGNLADVALGYDNVSQYILKGSKRRLIPGNFPNPLQTDTAMFGAIVGRVANRISGAQFSLNGKTYRLIANDGKNTLHGMSIIFGSLTPEFRFAVVLDYPGGPKGFAKVIWTVKNQKAGKFPYITFTYHSSDGDQGFPGSLDVSVTYKIVGDYDLRVVMRAKALNKPTPVNLAQHTYWNLAGHNSGDILSNTLEIFASHCTPLDKDLIPTGQIVPVKGTPYDFLHPTTIGRRINQIPPGYNMNYVLDPLGGPSGEMKKVAYLKDKKSGRALELWANTPGVQLYTSNYLKAVGKGGYEYKPHGAVCLETQGFPDSVNHPNFPSQIVNPGETYKHDMLFKFSSNVNLVLLKRSMVHLLDFIPAQAYLNPLSLSSLGMTKNVRSKNTIYKKLSKCKTFSFYTSSYDTRIAGNIKMGAYLSKHHILKARSI